MKIALGDRVYTSFNQVVKTGRMSSEQPNIQNIPPELRRYFIAPLFRRSQSRHSLERYITGLLTDLE